MTRNSNPAWTHERVSLQTYDPHWVIRASAEIERLRELLGPWLVDGVEHIGSTAVPGLAAKPTIDLVASVDDLSTIVGQVSKHLFEDGWYYMHPARDGLWWRRFFVKPDSSGQHREVHLHLVQAGHPSWNDMIAFRDELRRDSRLAQSYEVLKKRLAQRHGDNRTAYTAGKTEFVATVLERCGRSARESLGRDCG